MQPAGSQTAITPRLADRLAETRRRRFVGRRAELDAFRAALDAPEPPFALLHVHGPGGVGKSALLRAFSEVAVERGRPVVALDGRNVEPSPAGFLAALRQVTGMEPGRCAVPVPPDGVLLLDTYEKLAPLDGWLREAFLPQMPAGAIAVTAGRYPLASAWRTDLGWAELSRAVHLGNLRPEEARAFLAASGVPAERQGELLAFTRGHPLALALVAGLAQTADRPEAIDPAGAPDVVRALLERLVSDVPSPAHRRAVEASVLAWTTTEPLLADLVQEADAHELFAWLRGQPFMETGPFGLFPHDLAREALDADFRWRDPDRYLAVSRAVYCHLQARIGAATGLERQRLQLDALFAIRNKPAIRPYFDWDAMTGVYAEPATAADEAFILETVGRHEPDAAVSIARHWFARQPGAFLVFRESEGERFGFMVLLELHRASEADAAADPAVAPALAFVARHGPVHPGEEVLYLRSWMHREHYQAVTAAINLTAMNVVTQWLTRPRLAWSFIAMADPAFWTPHFDGINSPRAWDADFAVDDRTYGVFAHDWRIEPAAMFVLGEHVPMPFAGSRAGGAPAGVLARPAFAEAVRQALRDYARLERLAANPLLGTRLAPDVATLQRRLREAAATLTATPKDLNLHRALWHTYFEPASTQELAAELLGIPFNTYRYRLGQGVERVVDRLWRLQTEPPAR